MANNSLGAKVGVPVVLPVANEDIAFTPTINNITATYTTRAGMWMRVANRMRGSARIVFNTVSAIGGIYTLTVPGNLNIDGQFIATSSEGVVGNIGLTDSSASYIEYVGLVHMQSATTLQFKMHGQTSFNNSTVPVTIAAGDSLDINFDIPILEWRGAGTLVYGAGLATNVKPGLVTYESSGSFTCYLKNPAGSDYSSGTAYWYRNGKIVQIMLPGLTVTNTATAFSLSTSNSSAINTWPADLIPTRTQNIPLQVVEGSSASNYVIGLCNLSTAGVFTVGRNLDGSNFNAASAQKGLGIPQTITYSVA